MNPQLSRVLSDAGGVLAAREHPGLAQAVRWAVNAGDLASHFKGIYLAPDADHITRVRALHLADPDAVATGPTAAYLHGWTPDPPETVTAASKLRSRPGYALERRRVPRVLRVVREGVRCASGALTAIDLATEFGASHIDEALRRRIPLEKLWEAYHLTPNRRGRERVRRWLRESRTLPWSAAERAAHAALNEAGVRGWVANMAVPLSLTDTAWLDIAFRSLRLAFEIDGREFHDNPWSFERDRIRDARLAALGWQVVRLPASLALGSPRAFAGRVRQIVDARARIMV